MRYLLLIIKKIRLYLELIVNLVKMHSRIIFFFYHSNL